MAVVRSSNSKADDDDNGEQQQQPQQQQLDEHELSQICQVSQSRAKELLEAASGNLHRAVDIHYSFQQSSISNSSSTTDVASSQVASVTDDGVKKKRKHELASEQQDENDSKTKGKGAKRKTKTEAMTPSPTAKQATLDGFLGISPSQKTTTIKKARKGGSASHQNKSIDSFFSTPSTEDCKEEEDKHDGVEERTSASGGSLASGSDRDCEDDSHKKVAARPKRASTHTNMDSSTSVSVIDDANNSTNNNSSWLEYRVLAQTLAEMTSTTKRNVKLKALQDLFATVIRSAGGIGNTTTANTDRWNDSLQLTYTIDLVLGKLSILTNELSSSVTTITTATLSPPPPPLQVSGSAVSTAVQTVTGASRKQLSEAYRRTGDMGDVAAEFFAANKKNSALRFFLVQNSNGNNSNSKKRRLTIATVHQMLQAIATVPAGKGSQAARQNLLVKLLRSCHDKDELRFLVRALLGNMRLGATIKTVLVALAAAAADNAGSTTNNNNSSSPITKKEEVVASTPTLEETFHVCPRIPEIAHALLRGGVAFAAEHCTLAVGFPIQPMLANAASSFEQVRDFLKVDDDSNKDEDLAAVLEWKYDGVRCQAHYWDGSTVNLFSRHLLDTTDQFPDVVAFLLEAKSKDVESFVVDAEIVAIADDAENRNGIRLLPFQDLSTRRGTSKQESSDVNGVVRVGLFCFDLVYLNGQSLLKEPLWKRQELMRAHFNETAGFRFASSVPLKQYDEALVRTALENAVKDGAEGLMIKLTGETVKHHSTDCSISSSLPLSTRTFGYEPGTRGKLWLKLKKDYVAGYADTIDVVPIGAWYGSGRKAQKDFLSPVLFAVYDEEEGTFQSISRCMSFSDDMYISMREFYFRGTPYPPGVGISTSDDGGSAQEDETDDVASNQEVPVVLPSDEIATQTKHDDGSDNGSDVAFERVNCLPSRPSSYITNETPSVWFKALEVFEVSFADLSLSRAHAAANEHLDSNENRGIALRFPRFKRRRPDKSVEQATTASQIAELYRQQSKVSS